MATNWAPGDWEYRFYNGAPPAGYTGNYNYWTDNSQSETNPGTGSFPIVNTPELTAKTQIFPANGWRTTSGTIGRQGSNGFYWTATLGNSTNGYFLWFSATYMIPVLANYPFANGHSIRCVRP